MIGGHESLVFLLNGDAVHVDLPFEVAVVPESAGAMAVSDAWRACLIKFMISALTLGRQVT